KIGLADEIGRFVQQLRRQRTGDRASARQSFAVERGDDLLRRLERALQPEAEKVDHRFVDANLAVVKQLYQHGAQKDLVGGLDGDVGRAAQARQQVRRGQTPQVRLFPRDDQQVKPALAS